MLEYDFPPYRPPNEAYSVLIRASRGCPWNKCIFCTMYKTMKFQPKPLNEIKKDIDTAVQLYPGIKTVFIADSDSLAMKHIEEVIEYIKIRFPDVERITSYARAKTLKKLGLQRLKRIKKVGLTRVHVGLESGDKKTLEFMRKGITPEEMIAGGKAAKDVGLTLSFYILIGAGGKENLLNHAIESAKVCNAVNPDFLRLRTLIVQKESVLWEYMKSRCYIATSPLEKLLEIKTFLEHLDVTDCELTSDHFTNYLWINKKIVFRGIYGNLPLEKQYMLNILNQTLSSLSTTEGKIFDATMMYERGHISHL